MGDQNIVRLTLHLTIQWLPPITTHDYSYKTAPFVCLNLTVPTAKIVSLTLGCFTSASPHDKYWWPP